MGDCGEGIAIKERFIEFLRVFSICKKHGDQVTRLGSLTLAHLSTIMSPISLSDGAATDKCCCIGHFADLNGVCVSLGVTRDEKP